MNYSTVQQPQISPLAKVQPHMTPETSTSHLQEKQSECTGAAACIRLSRCTLLEEGQLLYFLRQYVTVECSHLLDTISACYLGLPSLEIKFKKSF